MDLQEPPHKRQRTLSRNQKRLKPIVGLPPHRGLFKELQRVESNWGFEMDGFTFERGWIGYRRQTEVFLRRRIPGSGFDSILKRPDFLRGDYCAALKNHLQQEWKKSVNIEYVIDKMNYGDRDTETLYISRCKHPGIDGEGYGSSSEMAVQEAALDVIQKLGFATEQDIVNHKKTRICAVLPEWVRVDPSKPNTFEQHICICCDCKIGNQWSKLEVHRKGKKHQFYWSKYIESLRKNKTTSPITDAQPKNKHTGKADTQALPVRTESFVCCIGQLPKRINLPNFRFFLDFNGIKFTTVELAPKNDTDEDSFGWVDAASKKDYEKVLALNGSQYRGRSIKVNPGFVLKGPEKEEHCSQNGSTMQAKEGHSSQSKSAAGVIGLNQRQKMKLANSMEQTNNKLSTATTKVSQCPTIKLKKKDVGRVSTATTKVAKCSKAEPKKKNVGRDSLPKPITEIFQYKVGNYSGALLEYFQDCGFKVMPSYSIRREEGLRIVVATCKHIEKKFKNGIGTAYRKSTAKQFASLDFIIKIGLVTLEENQAFLKSIVKKNSSTIFL